MPKYKRESSRHSEHTAKSTQILKSVLQRELQHPRRSTGCRRGRRIGRDETERTGGARARSGIARIKVIDHIERLETDFHPLLLVDREFSRDRLIPFPESRAEHGVLARIAEGAQGGRREGSRVQPLRTKGDGRAARRALSSRINIRQHLVRKLCRTRVASVSGDRVRAHACGDVEGRASPCNDGRGPCPAARDHSCDPVGKLRRLRY